MNTQNTSDRNPAQNVARNPDMHRLSSNQQAATAAHTANRPAGKQVPFAMLLPVIEPQLDRDRAVQLQTLYARLKSNTINKEEFVRHLRTLVGDHMLKTEIYRLQQGKVPAPARQNTQRASSTLRSSDASALPADQRPPLLERQSDSHGGQASHASNANVSANYHQQQLQQQHMNLPQPPFPTYGNSGGNFHLSASTNMDKPIPSYKHQSHGLQMRQGPVNPAMATQAMSQHDLNDMKRLHGGGHAHFTSNSALQQNSGHWQASMHKDQGLMSSNPYTKSDSADQMNDQHHRSQLSTPHGLEHATRGSGSSKDDTFEAMASRPGSITAQMERQNAAAAAVNSSLASGGNAKTPPKKSIVGPNKPLEAPVNPLSKKQKVVGEFADQSIEKLNDVTAVSGVNLRRVKLERSRHRTVITSDVRKQITSMNQKAREEWEKKQADVEKLQRADEPEGIGDGDDGRGKSSKAHQKREGGADSASTSHPSVDVGPKPVSTSERTLNDNQDTEKTSALATVTVTPASLAQATNHTPSELFQQRQSSTREEEVKPQTQEPVTVVTRIGSSCSETQHPQNHTSRELTQPKEDQAKQDNVQASQNMNTRNTRNRNPAQNIACRPDMHRMSSYPRATAAQAVNHPFSKQVPFPLLHHVLESKLDKGRAMQLKSLYALYARLRSNSISEEEFFRHMRAVVGDHMLEKEIYKLQQGKVPVEQNAQSASSSLESDARTLPADQRPRLLECQSDSHGLRSSHVSNANVSAINRQQQKQPQKQPQQHINFPHSSFPTYGDPMRNMAVDKLQIRADACRHYTHNHHHHHHHHLMDPSQTIACNLDNELHRTHIMNSNNQGANATNRPSAKKATFATLLQFLEPQLDKDRNVQLQGLYARLMNNSINKEEFVRHMRTLVGDYTLKTTMYKIRQGPDSR